MFDRTYVINLKRRPDRLENFKRLQRQHQWNLKEPIIFNAIYGDKVGVPTTFRSGGGAWGCLRSHITILEQCIMDDVNTVLVLEDDATWMPHVWTPLANFLKDVPQDWQQLMLGGQHIQPPTKVTDKIWKCTNTQRTHAYALKNDAMKSLLECWYTCNVHCDWKMGDWHKGKNVYCPDQFFFGQSGGRSDIAGKTNQPAYWDWAREVHGNYLLKLTAPRSTIDNLHGFHRGYWLHQNGQDNGLIEIATLDDKKERLKEWINVVGKEADNIGAVPVIWHPGISLDDLYIATGRTVVEVIASSVDDFMEKWKAALEKQEAV